MLETFIFYLPLIVFSVYVLRKLIPCLNQIKSIVPFIEPLGTLREQV